MAETRLKKWLKRLLITGALFAALSVAPYFGVRAFFEFARAIDGRTTTPEEALSALTVYPHGGFKPLLSADRDFEILQRQVLRYADPTGLLYGLAWVDDSGRKCSANAFVERISDRFAGWKGRGAWGHCSALPYSAWVSGHGEYRGLSVVSGLSGQAARVKVTWRSGEATYVQSIKGTYLAALDRHAARADRVEFFAASGELLESIRPYG